MKALTKRLRVARAGLGLTQLDVAEKVGIPVMKYWAIENGRRPADDAEKNKIARALKSSVDCLFDGESVAAAS
jgi:transcriptional regulator with XRE-family HTH domain